jgi:photosystem II stability/assembly factor-like uncharacterized protein
VAAAASGATVLASDTTAPLTGTASLVCANGAWSRQSASPASCAPPPFIPISLDNGGWFSGFAVHGSGRVYGYGDVYGTFRSDDGGMNWRYLQHGLTVADDFVSGMAVAHDDADKVLFRTERRLWKSINGGGQWTPLLEDLRTGLVRGATPVIFHPSNSQEIWLVGNRLDLAGSLWRSTNGGTSWSPVGASTFSQHKALTVYIRPEFPDQVFVGTEDGLYVSANRGTTWSPVPVPLASPDNVADQPAVTGIVRRADGVTYFASSGYVNGTETFNPNNGGYRVTATDWRTPSTYRPVRTVAWWRGWGPTNATVLADGSFVTGGDGTRQLEITPTQLADVQRISSDGGLTWRPLESYLVGPVRPIWSPALPAVPDNALRARGGRDMVVQDPSRPTRWFMTGGAQLVVSNDSGRTWQYPQEGIAGTMTYKTRFASGNRSIAMIPSSDRGTFMVRDGGLSGRASENSFRTLQTLFTVHDVMSIDGQTIVAAGVEQGANRTRIEKSTDGGVSWRVLDLAGSGLPANREGITRSSMSLTNPDEYVVVLGKVGGDVMWYTTNGGRTFSRSSGLPTNLDTGSRYHPEHAFIERDGRLADVVYFASRGGNDTVFRSIDGGRSWQPSRGPVSRGAWISDLSVDPSQAGRLWVVANGVRTSTNGGDTWSRVGDFTSVSLVDASGGRVAVWGRRPGDTFNKLYYSPDNGANWIEKTTPAYRLPWINYVAVDPVVPGKIWVNRLSAMVVN